MGDMTGSGDETVIGSTGRRVFAGIVALVAVPAAVLRWWMLCAMTPLGFLDGTIRFFSYFTSLSVVLVAVSATIIALASHSRLGRLALWPPFAGAVTVYILATGIFYNLSSQLIELLITGWWQVSSSSLHQLTPLLYLAFWVLAVRKGELRLRHVFWWLGFPLVYGVVTLVRGTMVGWYPYIFVNREFLGNLQLTINVGIMMAGFIALGLVVLGIDRWMGRRRRAALTPLTAR
jgi:hypothetical protein